MAIAGFTSVVVVFGPNAGVYFAVVMTSLLLGAISFGRLEFVRPGQTEHEESA